MKTKTLIAVAMAAMLAAGCQSTGGSSSAAGQDYKPSLAMTVTANSIDAWPMNAPIKFAYSSVMAKGTDLNDEWTKFIAEAIIQRFGSLGMTFVDDASQADFVIKAGLVSTDGTGVHLFSDMDPGIDTRQKGTVQIAITDQMTNRNVWEGVIQAYSDLPIATSEQRRNASFQLVNQLTLRLPQVQAAQ